MRIASFSKVALSTVTLVGLSSLVACSNAPNGGDGGPNDVPTNQDVASDHGGPTDGASDTGTMDVASDAMMDVVTPTDTTPVDTGTDAGMGGDGALGMCEISSAVATHVTAMSTMGWTATNRGSGLLMYGCASGAAPADCLSTYPLASATDIGDNRSAVATAHLRVLYTAANRSDYWTRISPDGRFVARGTHVRDLVRGVDVEAGPTAQYDPGFFPDNSRFFYQPAGRTCPMSILTTGTPTTVNFASPGCVQTSVGLYEHLGVALGGADYWATSAGAAAWDNGGHSATLTDPPPNSPWLGSATTTLTYMANTGTTFASIAHTSLPTPYQGDGVISPSSTLLMTRVADLTGNTQVGYRLFQLNATHSGAAVMASLTPIANYCFLGAKPAFSLDERWVVMHHYVTDADATELGFSGPTDPGFAAYRTSGASDIYLVDLVTGTRTRLTNMAAGQYALYPAFRSDGWIYFLVRTLHTTTEYVIASDAALVLP